MNGRKGPLVLIVSFTTITIVTKRIVASIIRVGELAFKYRVEDWVM